MIRLSKSGFACACLALAACLAPHARAGLLDDDEARKAILELRAKVDTIARDLNTRIDTKTDKAAALDLVNQHEQAMQEIAKLRGQIEVLSNELANAQRRQKDFYVDLDTRVRKLEPHKATVDGQEVTVEPSEQKAYDAAVAAFKGGDYKLAAVALGDFVRRYPGSGYAANAQYWLGSAYYALREYQNAIVATQVVFTTYAGSPKAPDALLNIAVCYTELKDKKNAKKALQELIAKFPDAGAAQGAKERLAALK
jgi:tol-pal system protein YbgF